MRPGSIVGAVWRCGKTTCHCAKPDDPGDDPNLRLTYKWPGKAVTQTLPTPSLVRKAEQEIAEFRKFQGRSRSFVEINEQICRLCPVEETLTAAGKKRRMPSNGEVALEVEQLLHTALTGLKTGHLGLELRGAGVLGYASGRSERPLAVVSEPWSFCLSSAFMFFRRAPPHIQAGSEPRPALGSFGRPPGSPRPQSSLSLLS